MKETQEQRFDTLLEQVLAELPEHVTELLDEMPLVVDQWPSPDIMRRVGVDDPTRLCGLYTGIPLTRRSVAHSGVLPDKVRIFRDCSDETGIF